MVFDESKVYTLSSALSFFCLTLDFPYLFLPHYYFLADCLSFVFGLRLTLS